jgi:hypothetical protein
MAPVKGENLGVLLTLMSGNPACLKDEIIRQKPRVG